MIDSPVELSYRVQRLFKDAPCDLALIGSRRMACAGPKSDWDFAAPGSWDTRQWVQSLGFREVEDYNGPIRPPHSMLDVNTESVWEIRLRGWAWQSGSWLVPGIKVNLMLVKDLHLCAMAYDFVGRDPTLIATRHSTPLWNRVYNFLLLGNPLEI